MAVLQVCTVQQAGTYKSSTYGTIMGALASTTREILHQAIPTNSLPTNTFFTFLQVRKKLQQAQTSHTSPDNKESE